MTRTYRKNFPTTWAEEACLNAHLTREAQKAAESLTEETRNDYCVILQSPEQYSAGYYLGPIPITIRQDRDGRWRTPEISPLIAGNGAANALIVVITDTWRAPNYNALTDVGDPAKEWTSVSSWTQTWGDLSAILLPDSFNPTTHLTYDGDEECVTRIAWLTFYWYSPTGTPSITGYRIVETVDD